MENLGLMYIQVLSHQRVHMPKNVNSTQRYVSIFGLPFYLHTRGYKWAQVQKCKIYGTLANVGMLYTNPDAYGIRKNDMS